MEKGKLDEALALLQGYVAKNSDSFEAYRFLPQIYWRKNDVPNYYTSTIKLCQLHLKAQENDAAWQDYQEYTNAGGDRMPAATWLELGRIVENQPNYELAMNEYERLARTYPTDRPALLALLSAGRLALKQLNRPSDALRYYKAASVSKVPHLEWDSNIQAGIQAAEKALGSSAPQLRNLKEDPELK